MRLGDSFDPPRCSGKISSKVPGSLEELSKAMVSRGWIAA
jgi:hypothetical protein